MSKTREKKVVVTGVTREQCDSAFAEFAIADARQQQLTAKMDVEISRVREKYQEDLNKLQDRKDSSFEIMQSYAMENKDQIFARKKSLETVHGILGFRTGQPKLKTLKGFTWSSVTNLLKEFLPTYVRTIEEPNKERLISDRSEPKVAELFAKVGIFVDQDEVFFVEPKKEETSE